MPLVARDDSLLTVIDLQPRFWAERLDAQDKRCAEEAARRAAWLAAAAHALGVPAVITEEDPEINGPTDEAVLAPLRASAPVFTKTVFGLANCPEIMAAVRSTGRRTGPRPWRWCMKWPPRDLLPFKQELPLPSIQPH